MEGNTKIVCDRCGWSHPDTPWVWTQEAARHEWFKVGGVDVDAAPDVLSFTGREYLCPTCKLNTESEHKP